MHWTSPRRERPDLPDPSTVASQPCSAGGGSVQDSQQAHASDLAGLEDLAERYGIATGTGQAHEIFREPDSVRQAVA